MYILYEFTTFKTHLIKITTSHSLTFLICRVIENEEQMRDVILIRLKVNLFPTIINISAICFTFLVIIVVSE